MKGNYLKWVQHVFELGHAGGVAAPARTWKLLVIGPGYVVDLATHEFLSDIDVGDRIGMVALAGLDFSGRSFDAADLDGTLPDGGSGSAIAVAIVDDTGDPATSRLCYYDDEAANLPLTQDGTDDSFTVPVGGFYTWG